MKTEPELAAFKNIKSDFVNYNSFEDYLTRRTIEREVFINDDKYTPDYKYIQLLKIYLSVNMITLIRPRQNWLKA